MLKLLLHTKTCELLGIHPIGDGATELVYIGQAVMAHHGKINYSVDTAFNYPTLAECYSVIKCLLWPALTVCPAPGCPTTRRALQLVPSDR